MSVSKCGIAENSRQLMYVNYKIIQEGINQIIYSHLVEINAIKKFDEACIQAQFFFLILLSYVEALREKAGLAYNSDYKYTYRVGFKQEEGKKTIEAKTTIISMLMNKNVLEHYDKLHKL